MSTLFEANTKVNNLPFVYEMYLSNDFGATRTTINPKAVIHINIQEDLHSWHTKGEALIQYGYINKKGDTKEDDSILYNLRNDGYDQFGFGFWPPAGSIEGLKNIYPDWSLFKIFAIYDIEEIMDPPGFGDHTRAAMKLLKIRFHDLWYQVMMNTSLSFSTAEMPNADANRSVMASEAIHEIFKKTLHDSGFKVRFDPKIHFDAGDDARKTKYKPTNNVFFTAPVHFSALDCVDYIMGGMVLEGENGLMDVPLLVCERGKEGVDVAMPGMYTIKGLGEYFERAGSTGPGAYQIERYFIREFGEEAQSPADLYFSPTGDGSLYKNYSTGTHHLIKSYELVDMNPAINAGLFTPITTSSFDFGSRYFRLKTFEPEQARESLLLNCAKNLKFLQQYGDANDLFVPFIGDEKKQHKIKRFRLSERTSDNFPTYSEASGLKELIMTGLFQSTALRFRTIGLPNRKPGRFIGVDYLQGTRADDYSAKLCGQWFVVQVNHIIDNGGTYWNDIMAVKMHRGIAPSKTFAEQQKVSSIGPQQRPDTQLSFAPPSPL